MGSVVESREVEIETTDGSRTFRTIIWVVEDAGEVFVRSVRGDGGRWYQRAREHPRVALVDGNVREDYVAVPADDVDSIERASRAFEDKYLPSKSVPMMTDPSVLHTTLRLEPS